MVVKEIMSPHPLHIYPTADILTALRMLNDLNVRHLLVVENGQLVGILSDRDVKSLFLAQIDDLANAETLADIGNALRARVSEYMSTDLFYVGQESEILEVIDIMLDHKVGAVPVIDADSSVVGIVTYTDVLKEASRLLYENR